jgi:enoyl-CoA hydratase/carnithine racemase
LTQIRSTLSLGGLAIIRLTRPKALNALNLPMIREITRLLRTWIDEDRVKIVLIAAEGDKAFCAGIALLLFCCSPLRGYSYACSFDLNIFLLCNSCCVSVDL